MRRLNNQKRSLLVIVVGIIILSSFAITRLFKYYSTENPEPLPEKKELVVAACPTFHYMLQGLEKNGISTIPTGSTKENLQLMERREVDFSISGRGLSEEDPYFPSSIIGPGYVFLADKEFIILEEEMENLFFSTDLSSQEILENFPYISSSNLWEVEDVGGYLREGIVITSPDNEEKGSLVHFFHKDGKRVRLSRVPRLYYSPSISKEEVELIREMVIEEH